ncbi:MAG: hypothetical protein U0271_26805 [Polyangiaceae bacterium]
MKSLELLRALVDPSAADAWYVTDGATAVGPVGLELLERGLRAEKVPADAFVRHESWTGWRGLADLVELDPSFDPKRTFRILPAVKVPPKEAEPEELDDASIEVIDEGSAEPAPSVFEGATDLAEAMLILLATVVDRCKATGALVHRVQGDATTVACSHGPRMFEMLGKTLSPGDAVLAAARQGRIVLAEPLSGVAGHLLKKRLTRLGSEVESAFMVPVLERREGGERATLIAILEVGRAEPYRGRDVAVAEQLVDELVEVLSRSTWKREWRT